MTPARYGKVHVPDALRFTVPTKWLAWVEIDGEVTSCDALSRCDADIWIDAEIARRRAGRSGVTRRVYVVDRLSAQEEAAE